MTASQVRSAINSCAFEGEFGTIESIADLAIHYPQRNVRACLVGLQHLFQSHDSTCSEKKSIFDFKMYPEGTGRVLEEERIMCLQDFDCSVNCSIRKDESNSYAVLEQPFKSGSN